MKAYTVRYKRDETGWWIATVKEVKGCNTQGRTIKQARVRIREALGLFVDDAESAELIDDISLPKEAKLLISQVNSARRKYEQEEENVRSSTIKAAQLLTKEIGVSLRDAGELLGLSYQRVQQLVPLRKSGNRKRILRSS